MSDLRIRSRIQNYVVRFSDDFAALMQEDLRDGDVLIVDGAIRRLYAERLAPVLANRPHVEIQATEDQKSYQGLTPIIERLIDLGFRKQHRLVAVGGGITQDVTGFTASILYRGVPWIYYPTTLLAQGDSCIGSKTSINLGTAKNQLGGFYPPREIVLDTGFLHTLPPLELRSGLGEMAHYFLVAGEDDFERFRTEAPQADSNQSVLRGLIRRSLEIKRRFIERDEFDEHERQVLNYGHTFGHAIESVTRYRVAHGIAVSYGMDLANHISVKLGWLDDATRFRVREVLQTVWEGLPLGEIDQTEYEAALQKDKKNADGKLGLILTRGFGAMAKTLVPLDDQFSAWLREWFVEVT